jgi:hypothetical protein
VQDISVILSSGLLIRHFSGAVDVPINRAHKLREDSMSDALSLATDANIQVLGLLQKNQGSTVEVILDEIPEDKARQDSWRDGKRFLHRPF